MWRVYVVNNGLAVDCSAEGTLRRIFVEFLEGTVTVTPVLEESWTPVVNSAPVAAEPPTPTAVPPAQDPALAGLDEASARRRVEQLLSYYERAFAYAESEFRSARRDQLQSFAAVAAWIADREPTFVLEPLPPPVKLDGLFSLRAHLALTRWHANGKKLAFEYALTFLEKNSAPFFSPLTDLKAEDAQLALERAKRWCERPHPQDVTDIGELARRYGMSDSGGP